MSIYKGTTLIAGALPNAVNQDLSNLSQTGQAVIDGKADTDLSNLTSTASANFDGVIVSSVYEIISSSTSFSQGSADYSLASYLPNDNYIYEVYFSIDGSTGATSGNQANISVYSSLIEYSNRVARARTRTSSNVAWAGSGVIPIGTNKVISIQNFNESVTIEHFRLFAYRRVGTNQ